MDATAAVTDPSESEDVEDRVEVVRRALVCFAADLNAGEAHLVSLVGELDALDGWADGQTRSCAHWLNWRLGISMPAARERVRVARRLRELHRIAEVFADGGLSYSKVRALTRVATEETEEQLLEYAVHATAAQLERICRAWRSVQAQSQPDAAAAQHDLRRLTSHFTEEGMYRFSGMATSEVGILFDKALQVAMEAGAAGSDAPTSDEELEARKLDALQTILESFLAHGPSESSTADHWQVTVHTDDDAIRHAHDGVPAEAPQEHDDGCTTQLPEVPVDPASRPPLASTDAGATIGDPLLRMLLCDAMLLTMVHQATSGQPLGVGRRSRKVPPWLRRMLYARDRCCQFPGCASTRTDAHHIICWSDGGPTILINLIRLCRVHHRQVHAQGLAITQSTDDRRWVFTRPDGRTITPPPPPPAGAVSKLPTGEPVTGWSGDPLHLADAIDGLVYAHDNAEGVSAGTSPPLADDCLMTVR